MKIFFGDFLSFMKTSGKFGVAPMYQPLVKIILNMILMIHEVICKKFLVSLWVSTNLIIIQKSGSKKFQLWFKRAQFMIHDVNSQKYDCPIMLFPKLGGYFEGFKILATGPKKLNYG